MSTRVKVVADYRERRSGVPQLLEAQGNIELDFAELAVGDYLVDDRVVFERKSVDDFASSIVDTRLFRQAARLNRSPHRPAIVLEGWSARNDVRVPGEAMQGALISLALVFDIPVLHARDTDESARLIAYSARQLAGAGSRSSVWRNRIPKKPLSRRLHILQGLPGIGKERAQRLLERFGTLERCMSATETELSAVEGIGPKTAASIREIVAGK